MEIEAYIAQQAPGRQNIMTRIHRIMMESDKSVTAAVEPMMGKDMIMYKARGTMKYGLAGVQGHMSLHLLPIYALPALHARYKALLQGASFQKGCINFGSEAEMPLDIVRQLITECAAIDMLKIREDQLKSRKK